MGQVSTRERVRLLLEEGKTLAEVAAVLGVSKPTVCYHKRRLGIPMNDRCATRYDWEAVRAYYEQGHSKRECMARFGFSAWAWAYAVKRGAIIPRPHTMPLTQLCAPGTTRSRYHVKNRLIAAGLKRNRCEECGISEWRGRPLSLALHHVNGDGKDNRLENLTILCPNCHSQTPNFGVKNWKLAAA